MYGKQEPVNIVVGTSDLEVEEERIEQARRGRDAKRTARRHAKNWGAFNGICNG